MTPPAFIFLAVLAFVAFLLALALDYDPLMIGALVLGSYVGGLAVGEWIA